MEIHVIQIGNSLPAPEFLPVAVPGHWAAGNARLRMPSRPSLLDAQQYREFFDPLVDELWEAGFTDKTDAEPAADQGFPSGLDAGGGVHITQVLTRIGLGSTFGSWAAGEGEI